MTGTTLRLWDGYPHTSPDLRGEVKKLQNALMETEHPAAVDGYFGRDTELAVKAFQSEHNLVSDGIVGPKTWAALGKIINGGPPPSIVTFETTYSMESRSLLSHLGESRQYREAIIAGAEEATVPVAVFWAIGSRESGWGTALTPQGPQGTGDRVARPTTRPWRSGAFPPDGGYGRGLMQIDFDAHEFARNGNWRDPDRNIAYGAQVLRGALDLIGRRYSELDREVLLRAGIAAYNCGAGNVLKAIDRRRDIDYYTAGRDYSKDVLSRAGWFQLHGF